MVLTAQGTSFIHSGQEYARTKQFRDPAYRYPVSEDKVPNKAHLLVDEKGNPVSFANVVLLSSKDSSFVQGTISNEQGIFSIDQTSGNNILRISCLGFIPVTKAYG